MKRRVLMTVAGVTLSGISVGMFNTSAFGMDPFQVLAHGVWGLTSITFGTFYMIMNLLMLVGVFFVGYKDRAAFSHAVVFSLVKTVTAEITEGPQAFVLVRGHHSLGCVLYNK